MRLTGGRLLRQRSVRAQHNGHSDLAPAHLVNIKILTCWVCWAVELGIGVLVASCPCALGWRCREWSLSPLKLVTKSGILVKNNRIFEKAKKITTVAFDRIDTLFTRTKKIGQHVVLSQNLPQRQYLANGGPYRKGNQAPTCRDNASRPSTGARCSAHTTAAFWWRSPPSQKAPPSQQPQLQEVYLTQHNR